MSTATFAFLPNTTGRMHLGNLLTYYANYCFARFYGARLVFVPDWHPELQPLDDDLQSWWVESKELLEQLGIEPDKFYSISEIAALRDCVPPDLDDPTRHLYVCGCGPLAPSRHTYDSCRNWEFVTTGALRTRRDGVLVGHVDQEDDWRLDAIVPTLHLLDQLGVTDMVRGVDLHQWVADNDDASHVLGPVFGWRPIRTWLSRCVVYNGVPLAKSAGAVPAVDVVDKVGAKPLRSAMDKALRPHMPDFGPVFPHVVPADHLDIHRWFRACQLDDGFYSEIPGGFSTRRD